MCARLVESGGPLPTFLRVEGVWMVRQRVTSSGLSVVSWLAYF